MSKLQLARRNGFTVSVPVLLVLLPLAILVPLVGFTIFGLDRFATSLRKVEADAIVARAVSTSAAIDREITSLITIGKVLAASPSLASNELEAFYDEAKQAIRSTDLNVLLLDSNAQQLVNTRVTYGTLLPLSSSPENKLESIATGKPVVSNIFFGKVAQKLVFDLAVPVIVDSKPRYVVVITEDPSLINEMLDQQMLQHGWNASVRDNAGKTFASHAPGLSNDQIEFEVQTASLTGLIDTRMIAGEQSIVATKKSELTGWTTAIWVPERIFNRPITEIWNIVSQAGVFAVGISVLVAYYFSRPFGRLITQIRESVAFIGSKEVLPPIRSILKEGHDIEASLQKTDDALRESQRRNREGKVLLDTLMETAPEGITIMQYPGYKIVAESRMAREWFGRTPSETVGDNSAGTMTSVVYQTDGKTPMTDENSTVRRASVENRALSGEQFIIEQAGGKRLQVEVSASPFHDQSGNVIGTVAVWRDVTEQSASMKKLMDGQQQLNLVLGELTHRAKNLLSVIMAIATQTARRNTTLDEFNSAFAKRIQGLGASHDLLVRSDWGGVQLKDLIYAQLSPFGGVDNKRVSMSGPDILLKSDVLQALGMAFHELATNATKYGALSNKKGSVAIKWQCSLGDDGPRFHLTWIEQNGPPVVAPDHYGFGHVIIVNSLKVTVNGDVDIVFDAKGLKWMVSAPLTAMTSHLT